MILPRKKTKPFAKWLTILMVAVAIIGAGYLYYVFSQQSIPQSTTSIPTVTKESAPQETLVFKPLSETPVGISIEKIGVKASIEPLGLTSDGLMDAPKSNEGVGWYNESSRAGENKYAVLLDGHYGTEAQPAVFRNLTELVNGDVIKLTGEKGSVLVYEVVELEQQYVDKVDMKKALYRYPGTEQSLTLITCEGLYDATADAYDKRTIVYAKRTS